MKQQVKLQSDPLFPLEKKKECAGYYSSYMHVRCSVLLVIKTLVHRAKWVGL